MAKIKRVISRQILDSNGYPTIEVTVVLTDGTVGVASSPSGSSDSKYEALQLRDNDLEKYQGLGVQNAIDNTQTIIAPAVIGMEASRQQEIDKKIIELDGTHNKAKLGSNATISVSAATAKAAARSASLPLFVYLREYLKKENVPLRIPTPAFSLINGGKHGNGNLNFQDFLVIPASSKTYEESLQVGSSIFFSLKKGLQIQNQSILLGDEGGYAPILRANQDALVFLKEAIGSVNLKLGYDIFLGIDASANGFYSQKRYHIKDKTIEMSADDLISFYEILNKDYHLLYLEDGLSEDDWEGWSLMFSRLSKQTLIVGDDLTVTNPYRIQTALAKKTITGVVIKPNQIGTVIEALAVVEIAKQSGLKIIVSGRSGETNDDFIADFAVAASADYVKFGAPARGERVTKYNRLSQIEKQLKS